MNKHRFTMSRVHLVDLMTWTNLRGSDIGKYAVVDNCEPYTEQVIALFDTTTDANEMVSKLRERIAS